MNGKRKNSRRRLRKWKDVDASVRLQECAFSFLLSRCLTLAFARGIVRLISDQAKPAEQIASELGLNSLAVARLLGVLAAFELVMKSSAGYRIHSRFRAVCGAENEAFVGPVLAHIHALYESWGTQLERWLCDGTVDEDAFVVENEMEHARALRAASMTVASALASQVDLSKCSHLVDVGSSAGHYSIALCKRFAALRSTLIDLDQNALKLARETVVNDGLENRISTLEGDYFDELRRVGACDVVLLAGTISQEVPAKAKELLRLSYDVLDKGGMLLAVESILLKNPTVSRFNAFLALHLRNFGALYTMSEIEEMIRAAGFTISSRHPLGTARVGVVASKRRAVR